MKKILRKLTCINMMISETKAEIKVAKSLPFYSLFKKGEKESDLAELQKALKEYYTSKHTILENLELEIRKSKIRISHNERKLSLQNQSA